MFRQIFYLKNELINILNLQKKNEIFDIFANISKNHIIKNFIEICYAMSKSSNTLIYSKLTI